MKSLKVTAIIILFILKSDVPYAQQNFDNWGKGTNTSTAVLLSIQPLPVDAGNLYTGNWIRGIGYSVIQTSLVVGAGIMFANVDWGHHLSLRIIQLEGFLKAKVKLNNQYDK